MGEGGAHFTCCKYGWRDQRVVFEFESGDSLLQCNECGGDEEEEVVAQVQVLQKCELSQGSRYKAQLIFADVELSQRGELPNVGGQHGDFI